MKTNQPAALGIHQEKQSRDQQERSAPEFHTDSTGQEAIDG